MEPPLKASDTAMSATRRTDTRLGISLVEGPLSNAEYDPSAFTAPSKREVPRSLISGGAELPEVFPRTESHEPAGGVKRSQNESLLHSRLKKKRTTQPTASDTRSSALLQSIAPKLGPVLRVKPKDAGQLKRAIEGVVSGSTQNIEYGLNYLLGWSLTEKGSASNEEMLSVMNALLEFMLDFFCHRPESAAEHLEASQFSSLVPERLRQCMAAGLILKNISVSSSRPAELGSAGSKLIHVVLCLLTGKMPSEGDNSGDSVHVVEHVPYSITRDVLYLLKTLPSLEDMSTDILTELIKAVCNRDLPLRSRTLVLDVLSAFMCQPGIKHSLLSLVESFQSELLMHLKILMLLPESSAVEEAEFEFEGGLDYDELAVFADKIQTERKDEIKRWAWRLQAEALLSATSFLTALTGTEGFEAFASDDCILQVLVDLTTGKKILDMVHGDRSLLESRHEVMGIMRRHVRSSEVQAYRIIQDILQDDASAVREKLMTFEDQFVLSAFDNTWQARQCAIVLSLMRGHPDMDAVAILASLKRVHDDLNS